MKDTVIACLRQSLASLAEQQLLTSVDVNTLDINVNFTKDKQHGDFASNVALMLSKAAKCPPRQLAENIIAHLPSHEAIQRVEIAGPGFINFFVNQTASYAVIQDVFNEAEQYGHCTLGAGQRVHIEYVSANPTGPLHVGHGRGAAYGQALADLLATAGYDVHREYYVNDAGRQMDILATSVWFRYLQTVTPALAFPANGYQGDYIVSIASELKKQVGDQYQHDISAADLPKDAQQGGDKEIYIDACIALAKQLLGEAAYETLFSLAIDTILNDIKADLNDFGVSYQQWFSERSLANHDAIATCIEQLQANDHVYQKDNALWFRSTAFGDEKDRVVQRENGLYTYFASDIAYHRLKLEADYDKVINIWGADHHGYIARVNAAMQALGLEKNKLTILLVQFANLFRGKEKVAMSTRSGQFVTLRELRDEVGNDATRFYYAMRKSEQHMDFDLELAKSKSNDNPVYYVQYAHARVVSVFEKLAAQALVYDQAAGLANLALLENSHELALLKQLSKYKETVKQAALAYEPHQIIYYLRDLATVFHSYYNAHQFIIEDANLRNARLALIAATKQVLHNALAIIGVSAPASM